MWIVVSELICCLCSNLLNNFNFNCLKLKIRYILFYVSDLIKVSFTHPVEYYQYFYAHLILQTALLVFKSCYNKELYIINIILYNTFIDRTFFGICVNILSHISKLVLLLCV
jgi:hypothetical protein